MAYGFNQSNSNGEIVISDENPAMYISEQRTLTSTSNQGGVYWFPYNTDNTLVMGFAHIPVGRVVGGNGKVFYSDADTIQVRDVTPFIDNPPPGLGTGWGTEVYDANGNVTYSDNNFICEVGDIYTWPGGGLNDLDPIITSGEGWFSFLKDSQGLRSQVAGGGQYVDHFFYMGGISRTAVDRVVYAYALTGGLTTPLGGNQPFTQNGMKFLSGI